MHTLVYNMHITDHSNVCAAPAPTFAHASPHTHPHTSTRLPPFQHTHSTVTKIEYRNLFGLVIAAISVVTSGMQQILCRTVQQKNKMASHELLARTAPAQGFSLILIGPLLDRMLFGSWVTHYDYSVPAFVWLFVSCAVAVLVNLSQFMCLGRFSAVSFQVCMVVWVRCVVSVVCIVV